MPNTPKFDSSHKRWLKEIRHLKEKITTREGMIVALTSLREQLSQTTREDVECRLVLEDTIKFFEERLRGAPRVM